MPKISTLHQTTHTRNYSDTSLTRFLRALKTVHLYTIVQPYNLYACMPVQLYNSTSCCTPVQLFIWIDSRLALTRSPTSDGPHAQLQRYYSHQVAKSAQSQSHAAAARPSTSASWVLPETRNPRESEKAIKIGWIIVGACFWPTSVPNRRLHTQNERERKREGEKARERERYTSLSTTY